MIKTLVLQPMNPNYPESLKDLARSLLDRLPEIDGPLELEIVNDETEIAVPEHNSMYLRHAMVRNYMLDTHLRPEHELVVWIDADLCSYPVDVCSQLYLTNPSGLAAPIVTIDRHIDKFFDIAGYIQDHGMRVDNNEPWFRNAANSQGQRQMESVGTLYTVPAKLYHDGVRYAPPYIDYYVEHLSVCKEARKRGYSIICTEKVHAIHCWLPDYGMVIH